MGRKTQFCQSLVCLQPITYQFRTISIKIPESWCCYWQAHFRVFRVKTQNSKQYSEEQQICWLDTSQFKNLLWTGCASHPRPGAQLHGQTYAWVVFVSSAQCQDHGYPRVSGQARQALSRLFQASKFVQEQSCHSLVELIEGLHNCSSVLSHHPSLRICSPDNMTSLIIFPCHI